MMFTGDVMTFINNLNQTVPQLMQLTTAIAYVLGMAFGIKGIVGLKDVTGGGGQDKSSLTQCLIFLAVSAALLYLPTTINVATSTFWNTPSPISYDIDSNGPFTTLYQLIFSIIQVIGVISAIRGLVYFSHNQPANGNGPSSFTKGVMHLVSGVFCIKMPALLMTLAATLGFTF